MDPITAAAWIAAIGAVIAALVAVGGVFLTIKAGFRTWNQTERSKRIDEEVNWKKERYAELIKSSKGFSHPIDPKLINEFLRQYNLCLMYCPDEIIHKINRFLEVVSKEGGERYSAEDREMAFGLLALEMRKDLLKRELLSETGLEPKDIRNVKANEPQPAANLLPPQHVTNLDIPAQNLSHERKQT